MADRTCAEDDCDEKVHSRGLCTSHYGKAYRNGTLQLAARPAHANRHSLSCVDRAAETAVCTVCGPVKIKPWRNRSPECWTAFRKRREKYNASRSVTGKKRAARVPGESPSEAKRRSRLKERFRITPDDYIRMLAEQGGGCAICGQQEEEYLAVDHDHACCSGKVSCGKCIRGLLCRACNIGIGCLRDDPATLKAAIDYLSRATAAIAS